MPMQWKSSNLDESSSFRDPYLRWAEFTNWRAFSRSAGWDRQARDDQKVQILAQVKDLASFLPDAKQLGLDIPPVYLQPVPGTNKLSKHFTAWVLRSQVSALPCRPDFRWRLAQPLRDAERMARGSTLGRYGAERDNMAFAAKNPLGQVVAQAMRKRGARPLPTDVIAVIDFGCPFLNPVFSTLADDGRARDDETRIVGLWDQGSSPFAKPAASSAPTRSLPWVDPAEFGYGREIPAAVLQAIVRAVHAKDGDARDIDEDAVYRGLDYLIDYDSPRRRVWLATHGAGVLDFAGGRLDPINGAEDRASRASLVFVQLPSMTASDSSGASLGAHLLDGVRFVLARSDPQARIVINISYGCRAGPQDGSSLIEAALDELLELRCDNFAIVVSAGNARQQRANVKRELKYNRSAMLRCTLAPGDTTDTFVEAWYAPPDPKWQVEARARSAGGAWSPWLLPKVVDGRRNTALLRDDNRQCLAMLRHDCEVPNVGATALGAPKSLVLLAVAPTRQPRGLNVPVAPAGSWDVELRLVPVAGAASSEQKVEVLAQIERDDPGQNDDAEESRFRDPDAFDEFSTLSSLAWGRHTIVAGGCRLDGPRPVPYSSTGMRSNVDAPQVVLAACERSESEPYLYAAATRAADRFRMNGTSVAAPVLARQLFNAMSPRYVVKREMWAAVIEREAGVGIRPSARERRIRVCEPYD